MGSIILLALTLPLLLITIEDLRTRHISLLWLLCISLGAVLYQMYSSLTVAEITKNIFFNLSLLGLNYLILTLYFSLKNRKIKLLYTTYLGVGDILFLISLSLLFSPLNFILFSTAGLCFTIIAHFIHKSISSNRIETIPLAGWQALFFIILIVFFQFFGNDFQFNSDTYVINLLSTDGISNGN